MKWREKITEYNSLLRILCNGNFTGRKYIKSREEVCGGNGDWYGCLFLLDFSQKN